jgi:hypothetical protein
MPIEKRRNKRIERAKQMCNRYFSLALIDPSFDLRLLEWQAEWTEACSQLRAARLTS